MRSRKIAQLGLVLSMALLSSCGEKAKAPRLDFYVVSGYGSLDAEIFVNGNPTNRGKAFSHFVIAGKNVVSVKGEVGEGGYTFRLGKSSRIMAPDYTDLIVHEETRSGFSENRLFSFDDPAWPHLWAWQTADSIESFGENDLAEIKELVRRIFEAVRTTKSYEGLPARFWTDDPVVVSETKKAFDKVLPELNSYDHLIHTLSKAEDLAVLVGKQMVMVRAKDDGRIFYIGRDEKAIPQPKAGGPPVTNYYIGLDQMFFAKFKGKWLWLMPTL